MYEFCSRSMSLWIEEVVASMHFALRVCREVRPGPRLLSVLSAVVGYFCGHFLNGAQAV